MKTWVWLCKSNNVSNYVNGWQRCHGPQMEAAAAPSSTKREADGRLDLLTGPSQVEDGGADNYCSLNSTINISSAVFVLTTPMRSLTSVSKVSCCFQLLNRSELGQTMLTLVKGPECLHGRVSRFCNNSVLAKRLHISLSIHIHSVCPCLCLHENIKYNSKI